MLLVDASSLIHLAMIDGLDLPLRFVPALVVYENGKVPNMLIREGLPDDVIVVTSRTFLALAAQAGYLRDPDAA